jgi:hypothetical protein
MKKIIMKSLLTFILLFLVSAALMAGKPFEGIITYKISYPDSKFSEAQLNIFPKVMTISVKGSKATNRDRGLCCENKGGAYQYDGSEICHQTNSPGY